MALRVENEVIGNVGPWEVSVPILSAGPSPPFLGIVAAVHGDEPSGLAAIDSLLQLLERNTPSRGIVILPVGNPLALIRRKRLSLNEELDLNRCSAGDPEGCLTMRIADVVFRNLSRSSYVVTLHELNIPSATMSCLYVGSDYDIFRASAILASYLDTDIVHTVRPETNSLYTAHALTLEIALTNHGVPCVTYETSPCSTAILDAQDRLARGLYEVACIDNDSLPPKNPIPFPSTRVLARCSSAGLFRPLPSAQLLREVECGEPLGQLVTLPEFRRVDCTAPVSGFLIQIAGVSTVDSATPFAAVGSLDSFCTEMLGRLKLDFRRTPPANS